MRAHIPKLAFVFCFRKNSKRKSLSIRVNCVYHCHNFPKSSEIFLSDDHCGPSTLCLHSRGLKIESHCRVRSQRNRREREGSLVTKVVDSEGLLIQSRPFHPSEMIFEKVLFLSLRHSKAECLQSTPMTRSCKSGHVRVRLSQTR